MAKVEINLQYPRNDEYYFESRLERINLDREREKDLMGGRGFVISEPQDIKKDVKDPNGIFSTRYGQTLQDVNPFADRYKCECGMLRSRIHHGIICSNCNTAVKYVDDDFEYFGWICLKDPYYIIHPNLYKSIDFFLGTEKRESKLTKILKPVDDKDENGFSIEKDPNSFDGIGMMDFKDRFDEIMNFYLKKNPGKKEYYDDIMNHREIIFIQSIPVYTALLRPFKIEGGDFVFENTNSLYSIMSKLGASINRDQLRIFRKKKPKITLLYDLQTNYNKLYKELEDVLAKKKGTIRSLFGGRYNFSSRSVIIPNPKLRIDEIALPYHALVELLQQTIINILQKSYNITYADAYKIWYKSQIKKNDRVYNIIKYIIQDKPRGIPILINRNQF